MINIKEINIGDVVYAHNKELRSVYKIVVKEITEHNNRYSIGGFNSNGVHVMAVYSDCVFKTKEEAIEDYLAERHKEIITVITSIK